MKKEQEYEIRKIVQSELRKLHDEWTGGSREGASWQHLETEMLIEEFNKFCNDKAFKSGRSSKSIACKIRNLFTNSSEIIQTW